LSSNGKIPTPIRTALSAGGEETWDLSGDLSRMPLISVLQFLDLGRQSGLIVVHCGQGRVHSCTLFEGAVIEASSRHLRGVEALIAMLELKSGRFVFGARVIDSPPATRIGVSHVIMESARLEDELERLLPFLPDEKTPIALRDPFEIPQDPLACGADTIMATVAGRPKITLLDLEQTVPFAPSKVRLALAWLSSSGRLRSKISSSSLVAFKLVTDPNDWYGKLLNRFPGGLRVLVGTNPHHGEHEVIASITNLAKALESGPAWMSLSPTGAAVARVRPRAGGLLSLACLPMAAAHEESFRNFSTTAGLVLLCSKAPADLLRAWRTAIPARVPRAPLKCEQPSDCLARALQAFSSKTELPLYSPRAKESG
jgi:hypothetical protein